MHDQVLVAKKNVAHFILFWAKKACEKLYKYLILKFWIYGGHTHPPPKLRKLALIEWGAPCADCKFPFSIL